MAEAIKSAFQSLPDGLVCGILLISVVIFGALYMRARAELLR